MSLNFIMNKYRVLGKKGEGTFSEVLKCQNIKDGTYWACKKMKQHYESIEQVNNLREIQAMRRLSPHPNILELNEVIFDRKSGTLVLICELMDMNIYELIRGRRHYLPEAKVKVYMYQMLRSIDHMHRNGIFHRDVKPENILIREDLLKLADFGSCRSVYSKQPYTEYISTRWYRAPECLLTDGYYTYKMDIWSVGCVFFEIMSLHPLFPGSNEVDQIAKIHDIMGTPDPNIINKLRNKTRGVNFNFPQKKGSGIEKLLPHASQDCVDLIYQMCAYDPEERISAKQSLRHSYFKEFREAEKRAAAVAKAQKAKEARADEKEKEKEKIERPKDKDKKEQDKEREKRDISKDRDKDNEATDKENKASDKKLELSVDPQTNAKSPASSRPNSRTTVVKGFPSNIIHKDPVYTYHRRERKRRKKQPHQRMAESGPSPVGSTMFPKVNGPKPSSFQPTFHTTNYNSGATSLPKINNTSTTSTTTYLPSLTQAFVKPAKPKQQTSKNMYGHYQLPSIDRRGAGY